MSAGRTRSVVGLDRRDIVALALVALSLLGGLALHWERLGDPLIDCGREMNQPLRLLNGERLYADVQHYYGPFSPYFNAVLLRLFGVHLDVLRASGAAATLIIVALVYWLARRLSGRAGAAVAALAVTWLCAFQPDGNFLLPYTYSAVHGSALALGALVAAARFVERRRASLLVVAGLCTGVAFTAKPEIAGAALLAGLAAAFLVSPLRLRPALKGALLFVVPAVMIPGVVYAILAAQVGGRALFVESYLLFRLSPPIVYFMQTYYGFGHPWQALAHMGLVLLQLAGVAALIALASLGLARLAATGSRVRAIALRYSPWILVLVAVAVASRKPIATDPMAAVPLILALVIVETLVRAVRKWRRGSRPSTRAMLVIVCGLFALASLARTALYVRSVDWYLAFLLPASFVVLVYASTWRLPTLLRRPSAVRWARRLALAALVAWIASSAAFASYHLHTRHIYPIVTPRGTLYARPDRGQGFSEAIRFVEQHTRRGEPVAVLPEGTSILFFTDRRNPLKEEVATPGFLDEERALRQLDSSGTRLILLTNRPTGEYGAAAFGRDYDQRTMEWILERFRLCGVFGPNPRPHREIGAGQFFIKAYCRP